jgi:prepilin-type processing-associated H-X9-DG protein
MKILFFFRRPNAFTLIDSLIVLVTVLLIGVFLLDRMARTNCKAPRSNCVNNLKQVGLAFRVWANEHGDKFPMAVSITDSGSLEYVETGEVYRHFQVMSNEVIALKILVCSSDPARKRATNYNRFDNRNLSYFVGVDADERKPNMMLSGDRNITGGASANAHLLIFTSHTTVDWSQALHNGAGNIGLADGSVQQVNATRLQMQIRGVTNAFRLAIP